MAGAPLIVNISRSCLVACILWISACIALPASPERNTLIHLQGTTKDAVVFRLGNITYLANTKYPKATGQVSSRLSISHLTPGTAVPVTVFNTNTPVITQQVLQDLIDCYLTRDDVFSTDFLEAIYISSNAAGARLEVSAVKWLRSMNVKHVMIDQDVSTETFSPAIPISALELPPGPYMVTSFGNSSYFSMVYRLYADSYRNFLYGTYETGDGSGSYVALETSFPSFEYPAIPVPSRLYSMDNPRPFAGYRVGIKDLFDMKGLITSAGSRAFAHISSPAETTAPSTQRIVDLGGVLVGKYKLAQFASGADPWEWQDEHYPFNPRGDGWLTCSASSSGGGCGIAAYDWLDFAIGSDTGSSMRRPAAVSGTYGQRPSQGMITLQNVIPEGGATDTAGVFARNPKKWAHFSKHWYSPELHESTEKNGLSPLEVPDTDKLPKTILYPVDYLPLNNSAAEQILEDFVANLSSIFSMTVKKFNFTATIHNASEPSVADQYQRNHDVLNIIDYHPQWEEVAHPLISTWAGLFNGAFPPIDPSYREPWATWNRTGSTLNQYNEALRLKRKSVDWYEQNLQYSKPDSCSESVLLYDIGTGGLPSYREEDLNHSPDASFLAVVPEGTDMAGAGICPLYGCTDFTVPIGQVEYHSQVTYKMEVVPVTINMVVKRGCDFVLFNMIERLADVGVLKTVKTGKTAF